MKVVKRAKKWTFSKGVSPWIFFKNRTFSYRCVSQKLCQKGSFLDILNRTQSFLDQKIKKKISYLLFSQKFYQKTTFLIFWKEKNDFK